MTVNQDQARRAVADLLRSFGHDPEQELEFAQTPALVVESWANDWLCGYDVDIPKLFASASANALATAPIVVVSNIFTCTLCPHHLLPAEGVATVAYLPGQLLLGLGTLARVVHAYSRRLTMQEQIGTNVVTALMTHGGALGTYCRLDMRHACLRLRGAKQPESRVTSTHFAGSLDTERGRRELEAALSQGPIA